MCLYQSASYLANMKSSPSCPPHQLITLFFIQLNLTGARESKLVLSFFGVRCGSHSSASACCKAGPNLGSAAQRRARGYSMSSIFKIVCLLDSCKNKSKRVAACNQTFNISAKKIGRGPVQCFKYSTQQEMFDVQKQILTVPGNSVIF
jgi:hypothetical protein